jgi:hypothetical protein
VSGPSGLSKYGPGNAYSNTVQQNRIQSSSSSRPGHPLFRTSGDGIPGNPENALGTHNHPIPDMVEIRNFGSMALEFAGPQETEQVEFKIMLSHDQTCAHTLARGPGCQQNTNTCLSRSKRLTMG